MSHFMEWDEDLAAALAEPFSAEAHQTKKQGGSEITFVSVHHYKRRLNATVGPQGWEDSVRLEEHAGKLVAIVSLSILGVTKENVGDEDEEKDSFGTACTNAYSQAFKRVCADFGLGAYLYHKGDREAAVKPKPWETVMPFGKTKGVKLGDHTEEQLRSVIDWCQEKRKFPDLILACEATLNRYTGV